MRSQSYFRSQENPHNPAAPLLLWIGVGEIMGRCWPLIVQTSRGVWGLFDTIVAGDRLG